MWHFSLLDGVLGIRRDERRGGLVVDDEVDHCTLLLDNTHLPIYRPLFERAEELAPAGLITRKSTPQEAMQVLWSHGESLPDHLVDLLESRIRASL